MRAKNFSGCRSLTGTRSRQAAGTRGDPTVRLRSVFGERVEVEHARTGAQPERTHALVVPVERRLVRAQRPHDRARQVVLAIGASRIAAWHEKQRRGTVDEDAPYVLGGSRSRTLLDLKPEADQVGHLVTQPRRVVLAATALREPKGGGAVLAVVHHVVQILTIRDASCTAVGSVAASCPMFPLVFVWYSCVFVTRERHEYVRELSARWLTGLGSTCAEGIGPSTSRRGGSRGVACPRP